MKVPKNSSAELINKLIAENETLVTRISDSKRNYAEFVIKTQKEIDQNIETISALEKVAEWDNIPDLLDPMGIPS